MKQIFTKPFLTVLAFDASMLLFVIAMWGYGLNIWITLGFLAIVWWTREPVKAGVAILDGRQKRTRIGVNIGGILLMIALVLRWALRINSAAGWAFSSLAFIVLLALVYAQWTDLSEIPPAKPANQSSEPTLASGTSPAGQEPRLP